MTEKEQGRMSDLQRKVSAQAAEITRLQGQVVEANTRRVLLLRDLRAAQEALRAASGVEVDA